MKAKLLQTLVLNGKAILPGADDAPVVLHLSDEEFDRLEAMSVVAKPSAADLKLATFANEEAAAAVDTQTDVDADADAKAKSKPAAKGATPAVEL